MQSVTIKTVMIIIVSRVTYYFVKQNSIKSNSVLKIAFLTLLLLLVGLGHPSLTYAMNVGDPTGTVINGWYKDSFQISIDYDDGTCTGSGTANNVVFTAGPSNEGVHDYHFMADSLDNPYLAMDGGAPFPLVNPLPCAADPPGGVRDLNAIQLDVSPPSIGISSPP